MNHNYPLDLAWEILRTKETKETKYIPLNSKDTRFLKYKDEYIEIIGGKTKKVLHVEIFPPLAPTGNNPIVYADDDGRCFRKHGETGYFIMYAERLLGKEITIGNYEHNIKHQKKIDEMIKK